MPFCKYTAWEVNIVSAKAYETLSKSNELTPVSEAAQSPEQRNDDEKERKKRIRGTLIKFGSLAVFAFIVLVFATISWFSSNRTTTAGGMSVTTSDMPFEIAAKGDTIRNSTKIGEVHTDYQEGVTMFVEEGSPLVSNTYYKTSSSIDKIQLRFDLIKDDPSTTNIDENNNKSIGPGSSGALELYIIPKRDGSVSATITMEVVGYVEVDAYKTVVDEETQETTTTTEKKLMRISDLSTSSCTLTQDKINEIKHAEKFLQGHIMFFDDINTANNNYSYSSPCIDRSTVFDEAYLTANTPYYKPIYWTWPNTLGQIAVKNNSNGKRVGIPVVEETTNLGTASNPNDKALVLKYLKDNKSDVFKNLENVAALTEQDIEGKTEEQILALINSTIDNRIYSAETEENFRKLSTGYNLADYDIGTLINYFVIEVTVTSGT